MGDERAYDGVIRWALPRDGVDALIVGCVPLAPNLRTLPEELPDVASFPNLAVVWRANYGKPIAFVVDSGREFEAFVKALRERRFPVFRTADAAARILARYLAYRRHGLGA
jgi:acyl-CoA synthetase (NDP forming)